MLGNKGSPAYPLYSGRVLKGEAGWMPFFPFFLISSLRFQLILKYHHRFVVQRSHKSVGIRHFLNVVKAVRKRKGLNEFQEN